MTLLVLAYLGGVLTIVSPCILPVLPFVFARADRPFLQSGLPMLVGMAVDLRHHSDAGGGRRRLGRRSQPVWAHLLPSLSLRYLASRSIFPKFADRVMEPLVGLGAKLSESARRDAGAAGSQILPSLLLGVATGLLWAPCAGPVLGLILTGAALKGASVGTTLLLLAYAAGAATSLALALAVGGRIFAAMKRSLGVGEWIRRALGVAVLIAVAAIAFGFDTGFLTRVSLSGTASLEQSLIDRIRPPSEGASASTQSANTTNGGPAMMMKAKPGDHAAEPGRRGRLPVTVRRRGMAQFATADARRPQRQGRPDRFLDLFLHQLPARDSLCQGVGREI